MFALQTNTASAQTSDQVTHCLKVLCVLVAEHSDQLTVYYVLSSMFIFLIYLSSIYNIITFYCVCLVVHTFFKITQQCI